MTQREQFDLRWDEEQKINPSQLSTDGLREKRQREFMIYRCGWEDGIRNHMASQSKPNKEN